MNQILTTAIKPAIAMIALVGSLVVSDVAQAGHYGQRPCNPAAEAHMKTAIRLMTIACSKPIHVSKSLARAAVTHLSLAQRFTRTPGARAELCGAKATLEQFIYSHCAPPFHPAIQQTRFALDLERSPCVCGRQGCRGGCQARPPVRPGFGDGFRTPPGPGFNEGISSPPGPDYTHGRSQPFGQGYAGRDFRGPYGQYGSGFNSVAARWGQTRYGH
jgi:hypothetical protein